MCKRNALNSHQNRHCVKSVQMESFFWSVFSSIWTEYGDLIRKSPYSLRILENTDQKMFVRVMTLFTKCVSLKLWGMQSKALDKFMKVNPITKLLSRPPFF